MNTIWKWLWVTAAWLLIGCATTDAGDRARLGDGAGQSASECAAESEDAGCTVVACEGETCGLYRCEDVATPPLALRGSAPTRAARAPQRNWLPSMPMPGREPVMVFKFHRDEELPSQARVRKAHAEWASGPKEKHHIFPRALEEYFTRRGINIHEFALAIDVAQHKRIHRDGYGGPWNSDWREFIQRVEKDGKRAERWELMEQAGYMIQKYGLVGMPMSYWQKLGDWSLAEEGGG
nr:TIGR02269 family lipoprotein [Myxococcus sp. MH1]